ncbi:hypothetical protein BJ944DRAFT_266583 [Cunninghamella echinulata]|nr:hypothetical protein BJ944DRAFT_266583 [Cunninghamella echinulata]
MKLSAIIVAALVSVVSAQQTPPIISVTSPLKGYSYKAGQDAIITWINPTVDTINGLMLSKGPDTALQPVTQIAASIPAKDQKYVWKVPADITPGDDYAFVFGQSPNQAYAGHFSITAATGGTPPPASNGTATTAPATTTAATKPSTAPSSGSSSAPSGTKPNTGSSPSPSNSGASGLTGTAIAMGAAAVVAAAQLL